VRDSEKEIASKFAVVKFPTLVVISLDGAEPVTYDG